MNGEEAIGRNKSTFGFENLISLGFLLKFDNPKKKGAHFVSYDWPRTHL